MTRVEVAQAVDMCWQELHDRGIFGSYYSVAKQCRIVILIDRSERPATEEEEEIIKRQNTADDWEEAWLDSDRIRSEKINLIV